MHLSGPRLMKTVCSGKRPLPGSPRASACGITARRPGDRAGRGASRRDVPFAGAVGASPCHQSSVTRGVQLLHRGHVGRRLGANIDRRRRHLDRCGELSLHQVLRSISLQFEFSDPCRHRIHANRRNAGRKYVKGRLDRPHMARQIHDRWQLRRWNNVAC